MIDRDGWFDWMIRDPAPLRKTNGGRNSIRGVVPHSAEGYWVTLLDLVHNGPVSWFASNLKDGRCFQHYSVFAQTWTSGAGFPNNNFNAWENEGVAGEPFTQRQTDNCVKIIRELSELGAWTPRRPLTFNDKAATLYEHKECVRWGADSTACPSGRVPWNDILIALDEGEDDMALELKVTHVPGAGVRLYALGQGEPRWISDPVAAADLERIYGKPGLMGWNTLVALGAK